MVKNLIWICSALTVGSFAWSATAPASPALTHPTGTTMPTGTVFVGTSIGSVKFRTDPNFETEPSTLAECTTGKLVGELVNNTGTAIEANIPTATFSGLGEALAGMKECSGVFAIGSLTPTTNGGGVDGENVANGTPWCLKSTAEDRFTLRGGSCFSEARKITYILDATKLFAAGFNECKYERAESIRGTFQTDTGSEKDAILRISPGKTEAEKAATTFKGETGNNIECPSTMTLEMSFTLETSTFLPLYFS